MIVLLWSLAAIAYVAIAIMMFGWWCAPNLEPEVGDPGYLAAAFWPLMILSILLALFLVRAARRLRIWFHSPAGALFRLGQRIPLPKDLD